MAERHEAIRTCIGCRERAPRASLVRYVVAPSGDGGEGVVRDADARLPGRGAWLHDEDDCRQLAIRRRALGRAMRRAGAPGIEFPEHR